MKIHPKQRWQPITLEDLKIYLVQSQLDQLMHYACMPGGPDFLPMIIENMISRVRAEIHGKVKNDLDDEPYTVPIEAKACTIHLIIGALQSRVPGLNLSEDQKDDIRFSREFIKRIGRGEVKISKPNCYFSSARGDPDSWFFAKNPPVNIFSKRAHRFSREHLKGL